MADRRHEQSVGRTVAFVGLTLAVGGLIFLVLALAARRNREAWTGHWAVPGLSLHKQMGQWTTLESKVRFAENHEPVDVVAIGDSSCLLGFDPARFTEESGLSALNLATHGRAEMGGHLAILRAYVERGGVRRAVVLWFHARAARPAMAPDDPMNFRPWVERRIADPDEREGVLAETNDLWGGLLRFRLLQKNRRRHQDAGIRTPRAAVDLLERTGGWLPVASREFAGRDRQTDLHPDAVAGMRAIGDYCRDHGFAFFVAITPFVVGSPVETGHMGRLREVLEEELEGAVIVSSFPDYLTADVFQERGHVSEDGARILTGMLATFVASRLD